MFNTDDTYYSRMANSIGDKARLLQYIPRNKSIRILDVGGSDGSLAHLIQQEFPNASVHILDANPEALRRVRGIDCTLGWANCLDGYFEPGSFDVVIASSILHEIFSYKCPISDKPAGSYGNVRDFFRSCYEVLSRDGVLLIRDGVKNSGKGLYPVVIPEKDLAWVSRFNDESPFVANGHIPPLRVGFRAEDSNLFPEDMEGRGVFYGTKESISEFLLTYTWGANSWPREIEELYGVYELDELSRDAYYFGYTTLESYSYIQEGYPEHLSHVSILGTDWFPETNAIWLMVKR